MCGTKIEEDDVAVIALQVMKVPMILMRTRIISSRRSVVAAATGGTIPLQRNCTLCCCFDFHIVVY